MHTSFSVRMQPFHPFSRSHLPSSCPYQFFAMLRELRKRLCLQAGIDGLPFEGKHSEDASVDPAKRVLADKSCAGASRIPGSDNEMVEVRRMFEITDFDPEIQNDTPALSWASNSFVTRCHSPANTWRWVSISTRVIRRICRENFQASRGDGRSLTFATNRRLPLCVT